MFKTKKLFEQLTGEEITQALTKMVAQNFEDFAEEQKKYEYAMEVLQKQLGENSSPSVKDDMDAIVQQTASNLLFSAVLGLKANIDRFMDPVAHNFLNVEFETYLRENTARRLPQYIQAQKVRDKFYAQLSPEQRTIYDAAISYEASLQTVGPKLAHYYGYLFGNKLLCRVIPGYHEDVAHTTEYCMILERYLGKHFLPTHL